MHSCFDRHWKSADAFISPQPEQRNKSQRRQCDQHHQGLHAGFAIGKAVGVDAFDDVVAGGGDGHRGRCHLEAA